MYLYMCIVLEHFPFGVNRVNLLIFCTSSDVIEPSSLDLLLRDVVCTLLARQSLGTKVKSPKRRPAVLKSVST